MPWEKSFDVDEALDRAANVFWMKGFEATSMSDLIKGMGINKGSLYNAFGSKKELFKRVLIKFEEDHQKPALQQLRDIDDPIKSISTLYDWVIAQSMADKEKKGNLIINTALEMPNHDEDIREIVKSAINRLERFFREMVDLGKERGSIPDHIDPDEAAKSLVSLTVGVRVLARGAYDTNGLLAIKNNALRLIGN
ncbi:conserved hypothetical protein [Candidatus Terasakiella magnetica]|uniref:HTH tetR-type domain-containing protein n=1 Tax=Candidatus Terasakiella magnetica TaxID=1867952 RepID=A0A1C3RGX3_9PROT|nr:TetR/AcrR family transcriptional regulator [Candidatus Terasakiella magnetica]SCA56531.1 conserved hypothetical protein [Candidatus Terasakiella magnetica]